MRHIVYFSLSPFSVRDGISRTEPVTKHHEMKKLNNGMSYCMLNRLWVDEKYRKHGLGYKNCNEALNAMQNPKHAS